MRLAYALYGEVAGIIERVGGRTSMEYLPEYRTQAGATPLSMPISATAYTDRAIEAYLKGLLLPDHAEVRGRWARKAGVRTGNTSASSLTSGSTSPGERSSRQRMPSSMPWHAPAH